MIKLRKLTMTDFGPVRDTRELEFPSVGTIGITGANGAGKTHATAALKFLLTGKTDRPLYTYIHSYGKDRQKAEVEGEFDVAGETLLVKRTISLGEKLDAEAIDERLLAGEVIKTKTAASLKHGSSKAVRAVSEVTEILQELTGIRTDTQEDAVFVDQNRAGEIFRKTAAPLQEALQELSGASVCARAVNAATAALSRLVVTDRTDDLKDRRLLSDRLLAELEEMSSELARVELELREVPIDKCRSVVAEYERQQSLQEQQKLAQERLKQIESELALLQQDRQKYADWLATGEPEYAEGLPKVEAARAEIAAAESRNALVAQRERLFKQLDELEAEEAKRRADFEKLVKPDTSELESLKQRERELAQSCHEAKNFLKVFGDTGVCPTCGSKPENTDELLQKYRSVDFETPLKDVQLKVGTLEQQSKSYLVAASAFDTWQQHFLQRLEELGSSIEAIGQVEPVGDARLQELRTVVAEHEKLGQYISSSRAALEKVDKGISTLQTEEATVRARMTAELGATVISQSDAAQAAAAIEAYNQRKSGFDQASGIASAKEEELQRVLGEIVRLEDEQRLAERKLRARALLEGVKTAMHRSAIPHDLAALYVQDLNERMATHCQRLHAPFSVFVNPETLRFMVRFEDSCVPISQLSGGQTTIAAWAWHLSLYERHGQAFGILAMDEPTTGVDAANMENLAETIRGLNEYCEGAGLQTLVITHEQALAPHFSHRLHIG